MFNELNKKSSTIKEGIQLETMEFRPLKDFVGHILKVDGFFFTTGRYGKQLVVIAGGYKINMPARAVEVFEAISNSDEKVQAVLGGHLSLVDIKIVDTKNGKTTAYTLRDC